MLIGLCLVGGVMPLGFWGGFGGSVGGVGWDDDGEWDWGPLWTEEEEAAAIAKAEAKITTGTWPGYKLNSLGGCPERKRPKNVPLPPAAPTELPNATCDAAVRGSIECLGIYSVFVPSTAGESPSCWCCTEQQFASDEVAQVTIERQPGWTTYKVKRDVENWGGSDSYDGVAEVIKVEDAQRDVKVNFWKKPSIGFLVDGGAPINRSAQIAPVSLAGTLVFALLGLLSVLIARRASRRSWIAAPAEGLL